ncbi:tRNA (adenosine(37)-N6)-dimethylallyltransferase MiaA [Otoolea muris]|uniref:tRNA (adenosine(37)-N6)-dimethylallyltransferase MiaA n=1 Tax=Otoolea muris TaxID=2941515 RepID=UPI00203F74B3|nr:tRNA (adenosine(37)-N6)-dimethylallyltransferase MiaA [Otoolea muris]
MIRMNGQKQRLIIVTGPTAVGKTALSVALAKRLCGEIISADSMQVYRHMDIGSAKVSEEEMGGVRHHLIDILEPSEEFNVARFKQLAGEAVRDIASRGAVPIVAGGTGFYIQALLYDIDFTQTTEDPAFRREMEEKAGREGPMAIHALLREVDPRAADAIHANNVKRVIRALEFNRQTGMRISDHNEAERQKESAFDSYYYVLTTDRPALYERIDRRVDQMMEQGLVGEVERLRAMGCRRDMVSMQGLGYKEILSYLDGEISLDEAVRIIKRDTRHFAKRQLTWFKREREVRWLNLADFGNDLERVAAHVMEELRV